MAKTPIFAALIAMKMIKKRKNLLRLTAHLVFCAIVIAVFGNFCRLRPVAFPTLYKEYLCGIIVLVASYTVLLLWAPLCLPKNLPVRFTLLTLATVLLAAGGEMLLVYPQIHNILAMQFGQTMVNRYILNSFFFVLARDTGFALLASLLAIVRIQKKIILGNERQILNQHNQIEVPQTEEFSDLVNVSDISYCEQSSNYTRIHLKNGGSVDQYGTLTHLYDLLGDTCAVRISRNCLVLYDAIMDYSEQHADLYNGDNEPVRIYFPRREADDIFKQIQLHLNARPEVDRTLSVDVIPDKEGVQLSRKQKRIFHYISKHPGCSAQDISKRMNVTHNTIYRHIARLKQQGLIEHVGANKTGGYRIVERLEMRD